MSKPYLLNDMSSINYIVIILVLLLKSLNT